MFSGAIHQRRSAMDSQELWFLSPDCCTGGRATGDAAVGGPPQKRSVAGVTTPTVHITSSPTSHTEPSKPALAAEMPASTAPASSASRLLVTPLSTSTPPSASSSFFASASSSSSSSSPSSASSTSTPAAYSSSTQRKAPARLAEDVEFEELERKLRLVSEHRQLSASSALLSAAALFAQAPAASPQDRAPLGSSSTPLGLTDARTASNVGRRGSGTLEDFSLDIERAFSVGAWRLEVGAASGEVGAAASSSESPSKSAARILESLDMRALEGKLQVLTAQRQLSALRCHSFLQDFTASSRTKGRSSSLGCQLELMRASLSLAHPNPLAEPSRKESFATGSLKESSPKADAAHRRRRMRAKSCNEARPSSSSSFSFHIDISDLLPAEDSPARGKEATARSAAPLGSCEMLLLASDRLASLSAARSTAMPILAVGRSRTCPRVLLCGPSSTRSAIPGASEPADAALQLSPHGRTGPTTIQASPKQEQSLQNGKSPPQLEQTSPGHGSSRVPKSKSMGRNLSRPRPAGGPPQGLGLPPLSAGPRSHSECASIRGTLSTTVHHGWYTMDSTQ